MPRSDWTGNDGVDANGYVGEMWAENAAHFHRDVERPKSRIDWGDSDMSFGGIIDG